MPRAVPSPETAVAMPISKPICALVCALLLVSSLPAPSGARGGWHAPGLDHRLGRLLRDHGVRPVRDRGFPRHRDRHVELGRLLFFDKELSGNRDVSCATCHHPMAGTGDGLSLPAGVGGQGLLTARAMGEGRERVPRHAPDLWNRGHSLFTNMFWDGRLAVDPTRDSGFDSPAGDELPWGLDSVLAAQAMFPVTSAAEMRGSPGENEIADASSNTEVWARLMDRLLAIDAYRRLFADAYPSVPEHELGFEHAANAIAAFEASAFRADDSPFDRYLRGDRGALSADAKRGAILFYEDAGCVGCHSGPFQTDLAHHAIAMPQFGPGKGDGAHGDEDLGRMRETGDPADAYAFRTPPLRNVALTGPWGHSGAYGTLEDVVRHHFYPTRALRTYDRGQALLPLGDDVPDPFAVLDDAGKVGAIAAANELPRRRIAAREFDHLIAFLHALTDPATIDTRAQVPLTVPSGLRVTD